MTSELRVLQLIDSLNAGGAERMAVAYSNAFSRSLNVSFLCCTREEGVLKKTIAPEVNYFFLNRKRKLDLKAVVRLKKYIRENHINLIHAHNTSFFLAVQVKLITPTLRIVWHDHYGLDLKKRKTILLRICSPFFNGIITVNDKLKRWNSEKLSFSKIIFVPNFLSGSPPGKNFLVLKRSDTFRILCIANLRPQKDHLNLIRAIEILIGKKENISLHLIGRDNYDPYSDQLHSYIETHNLKESIFIYGEQESINEILLQGDLGVLSSFSEGMPVALLEYGKAGLPVISTDVGECSEVIGNDGILVPPNDSEGMARAISFYISNSGKRRKDALSFQMKIDSLYTERRVMPKIISFMEEFLKN